MRLDGEKVFRDGAQRPHNPVLGDLLDAAVAVVPSWTVVFISFILPSGSEDVEVCVEDLPNTRDSMINLGPWRRRRCMHASVN